MAIASKRFCDICNDHQTAMRYDTLLKLHLRCLLRLSKFFLCDFLCLHLRLFVRFSIISRSCTSILATNVVLLTLQLHSNLTKRHINDNPTLGHAIPSTQSQQKHNFLEQSSTMACKASLIPATDHFSA